MKTTNDQGQPISQAFKDAWNDPNMSTKAKVLVEWGNNRFNGNHTCTASSTKLVNWGINDAFKATTVSNFWTPEEAFNNRNKNSMRWAVCDNGALATGPNSTSSPWRAVNIEDVQGEYEHGWWSANKSNGSGIFTTPEWIQCIYETVRPINQVWLFTDEAYPNMKQISLQYTLDGSTWIDVPGATLVTLPTLTWINKFVLPSTIQCIGLKMIVYSTAVIFDFARCSELQGILYTDISSDIVTIDIEETREQFDGTVPIGILKTVTCNGQVQNVDQTYSTTNSSSPVYPYVSHDNRIEVYFGIDTTGHGGSGFEYVQMGEYFVDQWDIDGSNVTARWGARDYGKTFQDNLVGFAKVWRNDNVTHVITDLVQRAGKTASQIHIDQYALRTFPLLYVHDVSFWNFLAEVAFADEAFFGFDGVGDFNYTSYKQLSAPPYTSAVYTLDQSTNIIDGTAKTELYLNRVIVDVNAVNDADIGRRIIWQAPDPTICSWNFLASSISSTAMTIPVTLNNTTQAFYNTFTIGPNGEQLPDPLGGNTDIYLLIDNEIIYCNSVDASNFYVYPGSPLQPVDPILNPTGRGWLMTQPASHSSGAYIGEAKVFDTITWQVSPALQIYYPYLTAIDGLEALYPNQIVNNSTINNRNARGTVIGNKPLQQDQAAIVYWSYNAFGAKLAVANLVPAYTALRNSQQSPSYSSTPVTHQGGTVDHYRNDTLDWDCVIAGQATLERASSRKQGKAILTNKRLVRKHGKSEIEVNNPWIQTQDHANQISVDLITQYNTPRSVIQIRAITDPRLDLADRVTITNYSELDITNIDYNILNINYNYDGSLQTTLSLRQVLS